MGDKRGNWKGKEDRSTEEGLKEEYKGRVRVCTKEGF